MNIQPEALRLAYLLEVSSDNPTLINVDKRCASELRRLHEVNQELLEALDKLARLGNGDQYGNSDGNMIARAAIAKATGERDDEIKRHT